MDSRDFIVIGALGVGGYFAWKWWKNRPIANAGATAAGTPAGNGASGMESSAARTTVFGGTRFFQRLLAPVSTASAAALRPTNNAAAAVAREAAAFTDERTKVLNAMLAPAPAAPSPSAILLSGVGRVGTQPTMPSGELPAPGDPAEPYSFLRRSLLS